MADFSDPTHLTPGPASMQQQTATPKFVVFSFRHLLFENAQPHVHTNNKICDGTACLHHTPWNHRSEPALLVNQTYLGVDVQPALVLNQILECFVVAARARYSQNLQCLDGFAESLESQFKSLAELKEQPATTWNPTTSVFVCCAHAHSAYSNTFPS